MGAHDTISLAGMTFYAYHGARAEERTLGQRFIVDVDVRADLAQAGATDALADTINYSRVYQIVRAVLEGEPRNLLEALGAAVASGVLTEFAAAQAVRVRVAKPGVAIAGSILREAAVTVTRERSRP